MSLSNATETDILALLFNLTSIPSYGSTLYVALHTSDPGEAGTGSTNEAAYGSYARVAVNRNSGGWLVSGNTASNVGVVAFPQCTSGSETETYVSITVASSGASQILFSGALNSPLAVSTNITPTFAIGAIQATMD